MMVLICPITPSNCVASSSRVTAMIIVTSPVEGRLVRGFEGLDVGDRVEVTLKSTDVERGFIDFERR